MSLLLKKTENGHDSIIINDFGLVLSQVTYIPDEEQHLYDATDVTDQVGIRYEDLDRTIHVLRLIQIGLKRGIALNEGIYQKGMFYYGKRLHNGKIGKGYHGFANVMLKEIVMHGEVVDDDNSMKKVF
jgi:hypothetical protein